MDKLVDQYNNTYHAFIYKKPVDTDYSALNEEIESNHKDPKLTVGNRVRITKYKDISSKGSIENRSREIIAINSVLYVRINSKNFL